MKFELSNLPRNCSNEDVIAEIKRVDLIVGKDILTQADYNKHAKMLSDGIKKRFGSWEKALISAGLGHKYIGTIISERMKNQDSKKLTNEEILNELRTVAKKLNRDYITREDIRTHSEIISSSTVTCRFGSWINGIEKAGLKTAPAYNRKFSENEYFENLLNVWTHYGKQPDFRKMSKPPSVIGPKTYQRHYGSWRKALETFVAKMNQETVGADSDELQTEEPKEIVREEIKQRSVLAEHKRDIKLGIRYKVLNRDKFRCSRCGASPAVDPTCKLHVDHIVPFSKGGKTTLENLQTLCEKCNLGKGNRHSE